MNDLAFVIEDNPDLATIFSQALKSVGFEPHIIADGQVAMDELAVTRPGLIVLDMHLPHQSGETILETIRADDRLATIPVIIATADTSVPMSASAEQADLVLIKPVSFSQLRDLAKRLRSTIT